MNVHDGSALSRLRGSSERRPRSRPLDAEIFRPPRFRWLLGLAILCVLLQTTWLHGLVLREARVSLLTVLVVWTGLRCGVTTGAWLGFAGGLLEDALGGGGANVLGCVLIGYAAGLLSNRFFSDSLPVFVSAVAGATLVRAAASYAVMELAFGERALFHRASHLLVWEVVLNCAVAAIALFALRVRSHLAPAAN